MLDVERFTISEIGGQCMVSSALMPLLISLQCTPLFSGRDNPPKLPLPVGGPGHPSNIWFLVPTRVYPFSIGSVVFAGLTNVTNRQTDQQTHIHA